MSELVLAGVSHRTAGVELRERVALSPVQATSLLQELVALPAIAEALALSTCGRTELYALTSDADVATAALQQRLTPASAIRTARGRDAVEHLFRVAAGLESSVLGEVEILGQLRGARELARDAGAGSLTMTRLVDRALAAGRLAREQTGLGAGRASIASVAVGIARSLLGDRSGRALVIGSGDTGAKTARALAAEGMDITIVAGRRPERARRLAAEVGGRAVSIQRGLFGPLLEADVVLSCTASPHTLVSAELLARALERRREQLLLVFDLAMPRDFDPAARALTGVRLYDLDDMTHVAQTAADERAAAVPAAAELVAAEAERSARWLAGLSAVPTIKRLRLSVEDAVLDALQRSELAAAADEPRLRAVSKAIVARLLHHPTLRLRDAAALGDGERLAAAAQHLFALENP